MCEEWLYQYVPHSKAEEFRRGGWEIHPLLGKHGVWSCLAVKEKEGMVKGFRRWLVKKLLPVSAFPVSARSRYIPVSGKEAIVDTSGFSQLKLSPVYSATGPRIRVKRVKKARSEDKPGDKAKPYKSDSHKKPG
jgi:hypothetical protein